MSLEVAIQENTAAINALVALLSKQSPIANVPPCKGHAVESAKEEKKAEVKKPAPTPPAPEPSQAAAPAPVSESPSKLTYDEVKNLVLKVNREKGREATVALLSSFGATNAQQIPEPKWAEVVEAANKVLGS
jgi:hypothetical protein